MLAGTVVEPHRMLAIVGNRSLEGVATEFTLFGGNFGEGETFPIEAGHEISLQVDPGFYQGQWTVPGGTLSRDFEAVADVVTLVYVVPEHNQVFAENQWAGGRAGSPRGETELGWPHLASVQTGETSYGLDTPGQALLMAGNVSREALYARLTLTRPSGEVLEAIINPGQETFLLVEPDVYQATWQTIDSMTDAPYNLSGQFTVEPDTVTTLWVLPEDRFGFVQSPGLAGQPLE
jgi:hypothetical protein